MRHRAPRRLKRPALALGAVAVLAAGGLGVAAVQDDGDQATTAGAPGEARTTDDYSVSRGSTRDPLPSPTSATRSGAPAARSAPSPTATGGEDTTAGRSRRSTPPTTSTPSEARTEETREAARARSVAPEAPGQQTSAPETSSRSSASSPSGGSSRSAGEERDDEAPETYLDVLGEGRFPSVTLGASEPATFTCSLDGGAFEPCSSGTRLTGLPPGRHTLAVVATDEEGNADPTPATSSWEQFAENPLQR